MSRTVLILGTDHGFQTRDSKFTEPQHKQFATYVVKTARDHCVVGLAEEYSLDNLADDEITETTIQTFARELGLKHRFCDPDMKTRAELSIRQENQIRVSVFPKQLTEVEVQRRLEESLRARERYWLSELVEFNTWPVIFICGADHSLPFLNLLRTNNLDAVLLTQDWSA
jgi:hypothetical protein